MSEPLPTAKVAGPASELPSGLLEVLGRVWLGLLLAFGAGALLACPCGIGVGWWAGRTPATATTPVATKDVAKVPDAPAPIVGNSEPIPAKVDLAENGKEMTWQQLQELLEKRGMKTARAQGSHGMWFVIGEGKGVNLPALADGKAFGWYKQPFGDGLGADDDAFVVRKFPSSAAAKKEMDRIKDVNQRETLAWREFLFEGDTKTLAQLKKTLP